MLHSTIRVALLAALGCPVVAQAVLFQRPTDTIQVPGNTVLGSTYTAEARIMLCPGQLYTNGVVFQEQYDGVEDKALIVGPGIAGGTSWNTAQPTHFVVGDLTMAPFTWIHVAFVYDGTSQRVYLNGVLVGSRPYSGLIGNSPSSAMSIGGFAEIDGEFRGAFTGMIDALRISSNARYIADFTPPAGDLVADGNTVLLYNFNEPAGSTVVTDQSGNGWHGTLGVGFAGASLPMLGQRLCPCADVVLPDYEHLMGSVTQTNNLLTSIHWNAGGGRFQALYEASHFTGVAGISGPVRIDRLLFRVRDGEHNTGYQSWAGVTFSVGATATSAAGMSSNFASNLAAATMGTTGTANVITLPAVGGSPNTYNIALDLLGAGASFWFDPTSAQPNLLVDVTLPNAATILPVGSAVPRMQVAEPGGAGGVRGRGLYSLTAGATTGTLTSTPVLVGLDIGGTNNVLIPASNKAYGAACGGNPSSFYQLFRNGEDFRLDYGLRLIPDNAAAPNVYTVTGGAAPFDESRVSPTPQSTADDAVFIFNLTYPFAYPGGVTNFIGACTNGFVWLNGVTTNASFSPTVPQLLGSGGWPARMAPFWCDLHAGRNTALNPNAGLHVFNDFSGGPGNTVTYVTWRDVGLSDSAVGSRHAVLNFQMVMFQATGVVEFRYRGMPQYCYSANGQTLVGFSRGTIGTVMSADPQSRKLISEVPFTTSVEGFVPHVGINSTATPVAGGALYGGRAFQGQSLRWTATNIPTGALFGAFLLSTERREPGISWGLNAVPSCIDTGAVYNSTIFDLAVFPVGTATSSPVSVPAGLAGFDVYVQFAAINYVVGIPLNFLITGASHGMWHRIGFN